MQRAFELVISHDDVGRAYKLTRRHPYHTQTELNYLLLQLRQFEELARTHASLIPPEEQSHPIEQGLVMVSYKLPEHSQSFEVLRTRSEEELARLLLQLAEALGAMHEHDLIHGDLKPQSVRESSVRGAREVSLLAPGILVPNATDWHSPGWHDHLVRRAPEWLLGQQKQDARTDLYALGVLIFEQLAPLPTVQDLMHDLAYYSHQVEVFDRLPRLGNILLTLLEPDYSLRYQSASALISDIEAMLDPSHTTKGFSRGPHTAKPGTLKVPDRLIGQQAPLTQLQDALLDATHAVMMIEGQEGIGKTALLRRLITTMSTHRHMMVLAQCKLTHRTLPIQLLHELGKRLLYWPRQRVRAVTSTLSEQDQEILAQHCHILDSLFGSLSSSPGEQALTPQTVQSGQIEIAIHSLIQAVLGVHEHALVLCIDDLDMNQSQHFEFLRRLIHDRSATMQRFSLVISTRSTAGLVEQLDIRTDAPAPPTLSLTLAPLTEQETEQLIVSVTRCTHMDFARTLNHYIYPVTQGIPLLVLHALFTLNTTGGIVYERPETTTTTTASPHWSFSQEQLEHFRITDAMAEVITTRLNSMEQDVYKVLSLVALCMPVAKMNVLALATNMSGPQLKQRLDEACARGLLTQTSAGEYQLLHDRLGEEIRRHEDSEHIIALHEVLLDATDTILDNPESHGSSPLERHQLKTQSAHHAMKLVELGQTHPEHYHRILRGWSSAVGRSDGAAQFIFAQHLTEHQFNLLWSSHPERAFEISIMHSRALLQCGEAGNAMTLLDRALKSTSENMPEIRLELVIAKVELLTLSAFYEQALTLATAELTALGLSQTAPEDVEGLKESCEEALEGISPLDLLERPHHDDPKIIHTAALLAAMLPLTYISAPGRFHAIAYTLVLLNLEQGHTPSASRGYSCYGQLLALDGKVHEAILFGELAMELAKQYDDARARAIAYSDMANYIAHWTRPLESLHELNMRSYNEAMRAGDLQYAGYALMHDCYNRFFAQEHLGSLHKSANQALARCFQLGNQLAIRVIEGLVLLLDEFLLTARSSSREDEYIAACLGEGNKMALALFSIGRSMVCYAQQDHVGAQTHFNRALSAASFIEGWFPSNELSSISQLTLSEQHLKMTRSQHHKIPVPKEPATYLYSIRQLAQFSPENFQHKWLWLQSLTSVGETPWKRLELIEQAFEAAVAHNRLFDAGVIRMHASAFWKEAGRVWLAQTCHTEAVSLWLQWGASGLLEKPETLDKPSHTPLLQYHAQTVLADTLSMLDHLHDPEELMQHTLLTLNKVASSARTAALLLDVEQEKISQGAIYDHISQTYTHLSERDLDALAHQLPLHLIRMVTHGEPRLSIPDTRQHDLTRQDKALRSNGILTLYLLRVPLHQNLHLLLYLEHNQLAEIFTPEREDLIKAQVPMVAMALEALEHHRLTSQHPSRQTSAVSNHRHDLIALFEHFLEQIHTSAMLIEHSASTISPTIQHDLFHISRISNKGTALLQLLKQLESHNSQRVRQTCCVSQLITQLNTTYGYTFHPPNELCDVTVTPDLFITMMHTILLLMVDEISEETLSFVRQDAHHILLTLSNMNPEFLEQLLSRHSNTHISGAHHTETIAELVVQGLDALSMSITTQPSEDSLTLTWHHAM